MRKPYVRPGIIVLGEASLLTLQGKDRGSQKEPVAGSTTELLLDL
jgi:hypothetical protein